MILILKKILKQNGKNHYCLTNGIRNGGSFVKLFLKKLSLNILSKIQTIERKKLIFFKNNWIFFKEWDENPGYLQNTILSTENNIQSINDEIWKGVVIRSKVNLLEKHEKPSNYFLRQEKKTSKKRNIWKSWIQEQGLLQRKMIWSIM